jgi:hypothetical protein
MTNPLEPIPTVLADSDAPGVLYYLYYCKCVNLLCLALPVPHTRTRKQPPPRVSSGLSQ